jgi:N-acetylneuraminate synthase
MIKFIAEVSSNHHRDIDRSFEFIDAAASSGCKAVKFQLFKIEKLFAPEILKKSAKHRERKNWELPIEFIPKLSERCKSHNIEFSCTPFYLDAVSELEPYVDFYKIASYELLWDDLLAKCARTGKPVIISTGMANILEIQHAVKVLKNNGCKNPTILHCTSAYPTPFSEANLKAIDSIRSATNCEVGWSDHTVEPGVIHRAIHKWDVKVVEFHLDLDGIGDEFKTGHCWLPNQIGKLITDVNKAYGADGNGVKEPTKSEYPDREWRADPEDGLRPFKSIRNNWKTDE